MIQNLIFWIKYKLCLVREGVDVIIPGMECWNED